MLPVIFQDWILLSFYLVSLLLMAVSMLFDRKPVLVCLSIFSFAGFLITGFIGKCSFLEMMCETLLLILIGFGLRLWKTRRKRNDL